MPTVFRQEGFRFFFYSNEGSPREPLHVHVRSAGSEAKVWIEPNVAVADSFGYSARELREVIRIISSRENEIREAWNAYFRD